MGSDPAGWAMVASSLISTGASVSQSHKQQTATAKARRQQNYMIAKATAEAKAETARLENIEKERLEKLRRKGAGLPPSLLTGMSGVTGEPALLGV